MIDRNTNTPLTLEDIAEILANVNLPEQDTLGRLAQYIQSDPRLQPTLAELMQLLCDAYPEGKKFYLPGVMHCLNDLDALLVRDTWRHPREVLDDPKHCIEYAAMIRILKAWAQRAEDPEPFLVVQKKLEAAHGVLDGLENLIKGLDAQLREGLWNEIEERLRSMRPRSKK